ncbi:MAG: hypothetical protein J0J00_05805 [Microbacterium sp.]|nr:hypothetical protein [Microbacterium sp.]
MTADAAPSTPVPGRISPRKRPLADRIPVVSHLRNSIGLQRAMLARVPDIGQIMRRHDTPANDTTLSAIIVQNVRKVD